MTYQETLEFLYSQLPAYHRIGKAAYKNDLDNTIALDNYLGNPHLKFRTIHVAGTNGKGSVSHMIASVLQEAGYKTGLYTSPHLKDFRERIRVNGAMIAEDEIVTFVTNHISIIESLKPSFFELCVAMAFNHFAEYKVDVAVIEVGLGGRLDSTNIIKPVLSVITNIGTDHMDLLGDTFEKIAIEKAGVIKEKTPLVISETHPETLEVFKNRAGETGSEIVFADQKFSCTLGENNFSGFPRKYVVEETDTKNTFSGTTFLGGDYQSKNIQCIFQVFRSLKNDFDISNANIKDGITNVISNTGLSGRWQILSHDPLTICDTGHNKEGLEYVLKQLKEIQKSSLHMVIGFVSDKDLKSVLPLFPKDAVYYFTKASVLRALDEKILKSKAGDYGLQGESYTDVKSALKAAKEKSSPDDLIFIGGSTFIVADALEEEA
ncbi:MAG: bifunctional folylpolyglutamate synthase/dihydrofolate synthase [Bacteroidales bacterium]|nr:bifunctional folylpolyglutamate synthase/dihydrofolate synthase [Bacteroidales bacterium]